ncbi:uncharacterized protein LOC131952154 isoform X2 [Physella acuta]|nr:uncharacterized protein LOC131952154 isoform X2 [Physella acuta]XP_059170681.1 uncharacterized protein LOC131952154 isoform X2 [Physella acuta]
MNTTQLTTSAFIKLSRTTLLQTYCKSSNYVTCVSQGHTTNLLIGKHHPSIALRCNQRPFSSTHRSSALWKKENPEINTSNAVHDGRSLVDRYIFVKLLSNFYQDIPDGIILDTAYADSRPGEDFDPHVPVVLGLHDTPGTHHDLLPILGTFAKLGCRTIAPTFPGHGETYGLMRGFDDIFAHSTIERAMFIHNFLANIGIEKVDVVVAVGAACYPAMRLCVGEDSSSMYKSMALISPWPFKRPRYDTATDAARKIQFCWDRPLLRQPAKFLLLPKYKIGKTTREKVTAAFLLNNLDLSEVSGFALAMSVANTPRLVFFGEQDQAVEKELYYDVVDKLDIPKSSITVFKGKLDYPLMPGVVVFPNESYDIHKKQSSIISMCVLEMVKLFHPGIRLL